MFQTIENTILRNKEFIIDFILGVAIKEQQHPTNCVTQPSYQASKKDFMFIVQVHIY